MRTARVLTVAAAVAVLVACGDDDGDEVTRASFVAGANQACEAFDAEHEKAYEAAGEVEAAEQVVEAAERLQDRLEALGVPDGDEEAVEAILGPWGRAVEAYRDVAEATAAGDEEVVEAAIGRGDAAIVEAAGAATDYGATACAAG